ncbi:hypothetical protein [Streptomyces sp. NPDC054786]
MHGYSPGARIGIGATLISNRPRPHLAAVSPGLRTGNALVVTLPVQLGVVAVTGLLNLRPPRWSAES